MRNTVKWAGEPSWSPAIARFIIAAGWLEANGHASASVTPQMFMIVLKSVETNKEFYIWILKWFNVKDFDFLQLKLEYFPEWGLQRIFLNRFIYVEKKKEND